MTPGWAFAAVLGALSAIAGVWLALGLARSAGRPRPVPPLPPGRPAAPTTAPPPPPPPVQRVSSQRAVNTAQRAAVRRRLAISRGVSPDRISEQQITAALLTHSSVAGLYAAGSSGSAGWNSGSCGSTGSAGDGGSSASGGCDVGGGGGF